MEGIEGRVEPFGVGQMVYSSEHGEVRIKGPGREVGSYIVTNKDDQAFEVLGINLRAVGEVEEVEEEEMEENE